MNDNFNYTASDFLNADLRITEIYDIWHSTTDIWLRPKKLPRECDGLIYFQEGEIEYDFGEFRFKASPGKVIRLPSGIPYSGRKLGDGPITYYCVDFKTQSRYDYKDFPLPFSFLPEDGAYVLATFQKMEACQRNHSFCSAMDCKSMLLTLLSAMAKDFAIYHCHYDHYSNIMRYTEYLNENFSRTDLRISDLANHFHLSETHMRRIFKKELGVSPVEYLAEIRMGNAKRLLATQRNLSIGQVALECGYTSIYYFSNTFRDKVGCSPSTYREQAY